MMHEVVPLVVGVHYCEEVGDGKPLKDMLLCRAGLGCLEV